MKQNYRAASLCIAAAMAASAFAEAPAGYYSTLDGKKDGELKTAIHNIVSKFTRISGYSDLPKYFQTTDVYPESKRWWDMYSDIPLYAPSFNGLNREHSFPKSWWGGSQSVGAYVDLNHLYPSEISANTAKNNYPLGEVDRSIKVRFDNGVCAVGNPVNGQGGGAQFVFEPNDEYKGDFARTYFYMVTCYQNLTWKYTYMVSQNTYPTLNGWSVDLLMKWHRDDPVSQKEIDRNEAVFGFQNNRNPFIDMPELADYLWGDKKGEAFKPGGGDTPVVPPTGDPELLAPAAGMELQFGDVAIGSTATAKLLFRGINITDKELSLALYNRQDPEAAKMFSIPSTKIPSSSVCTTEGYWLDVNYKPSALGEHIAYIAVTIPGGGSRSVTLRGNALPVPTLSPCTATEPTDIQPDRYTANWTAPVSDIIDYFVVKRTRYTGSTVKTEELPAENNFLEIDGFDQSDSESYSVQSVRLGHRSAESNTIFVRHSGITGVEAEQPLIIQTFPGTMRFICSEPQTGCRVYDISGRTVRIIDTVEQNMDIDMPQGVYLVVTDQHPTPIKVAVQ